MATIRKRKDKYVVIYDYVDSTTGKRKQKWETCDNKTEANKRKNQIELEKASNQFVTPTNRTVRDFILEWAEIYAKGNWQCHTYSSNIGLIKNHILPYIGDMDIQKVSPRDIEKLYDLLRSKKIDGFRRQGKEENELPCLSSTTIRLVHSVLKLAFDKAVEWKLIQSSPVICKAPKKNRNINKPIWDAETVNLALADIKDPVLHLAVHIAFICSMRNGEIMALTWDCIDFDNNTIRINKTLQRIYKDAMSRLPKDKLQFVFPSKTENNKSVLVLKNPKTDSSDRYVYMTEQLRNELLKRKLQTEKDKQYLGEEYQDFNLVLSLPDGYPIETKLCEKWFKKWQRETEFDFPELIFHELRHSSTTYKLMVSGGDIKAVQGDTGHATADMVVNTYSKIRDKTRAELIKSIEGKFYNTAEAKPESETDLDLDMLLKQIKKDPLLQQKVLCALGAHKE